MIREDLWHLDERNSAFVQFWMLIEDARDILPSPQICTHHLEAREADSFGEWKGSVFKQQRLEVVNRWLKTFL